MPRYVITPDVAIYLAKHAVTIAKKHEIFAPTLSRSQELWRLYRAVREGEMTREDADRRLTYIRAIRMRLLGDRVLQQVAWKIADQLGWLDTLDAE